MRIKCPECGGVLSFDQAKPGNYRPTCKHCQRSFRLKVSDDDPPRAGVSRIPRETAQADDADVSDREAATIGTKAAARTMDVTPSLAFDGGAIPERLGGYKILRLIGKGAMGSVYEAKQISLDRLVALKMIRGRLAENPASLRACAGSLRCSANSPITTSSRSMTSVKTTAVTTSAWNGCAEVHSIS